MKGKVKNFGPLLDKLTDITDLWNISKFDIAHQIAEEAS